MKKLIQFLFFFYSPYFAMGQYHIANIAPDSIEQKYLSYKDDTDNIDFKNAGVKATELYEYWKLRKENLTENHQQVLQNYYNAYINMLEIQFMTGTLPRNFYDVLIELKPQIISDLGETNIVMARLYLGIGMCAQNFLKDISIAKKAFQKEIDIHELNLGETSKEVARSLGNLAEAYRKENNLDLALEHHQRAIAILKKLKLERTKDYVGYVTSIGIVYYKKAEYSAALKAYLEAYNLATDLGSSSEKMSFIILSNLAETYRQINDFKSAYKYAILALENVKRNFPDNHMRLVIPYFVLSSINTELAENQRASNILDTVMTILKTNKITKDNALLYHNRADLLDDLNESIRYYLLALDVCPLDPKCRKDLEAKIHLSLGTAYQKKGNNSLALNYYRKAESTLATLPEPSLKYLTNLYMSLGLLEEQNGDIAEAIRYFLKANEIQEKTQPNSIQSSLLKSQLAILILDSGDKPAARLLIEQAAILNSKQAEESNYRIAKIYKNIAQYYHETKDFGRATSFANKSIDIYKKNYGKDSYKLNSIRLLLAKIQQASGSTNEAKETMDKVSGTCGFDFSDKTMVDCIPEFQLWNSFNLLLDYFKVENDINTISKNAKTARIKFGISLIDKLRTQFFFESSEVEFQLKIREYINWSLSELNTIYQEEKDHKVLSLIFDCIEKSRSININRNFNRILALENKEIPKVWLDREKFILNKYEQIFEKIEDRASESPDSLYENYTNKILEMQEVKSSFLDSLQLAFPNYYEARHKQSICSLEEIQSVSVKNNHSFLLLHWGDSLLYKILISEGQTNLSVIETKALNPKIDSLFNIVSNKTNIGKENLFEANKKAFISLSTNLHTALIGDENEKNLPFDLSIVPDGPLVSFPFEVLLTHKPEPTLPYTQLPYFLRDHAIQYSGSLTQIVKQDMAKLAYPISSYVGFGPQYKTKSTNNKLVVSRGNLTDKELLYNIREVEQTSALFEGDNFIAEKATEIAFRSLEENYDILHLAMHASVDNRFPLDSYLSFSNDTSSTHDGKLHVHEIAKMNLDYNLVVLSACETNRSESTSGEGILGIARSFNLANCKNLIMTNWLVDDKSASEIIISFFENFKKTGTASHALREAKLSYLTHSSVVNSHPSYWATFSFYGYPGVNSSSASRFYWWLLLPLFLAFSWLISRKLKKNHS